MVSKRQLLRMSVSTSPLCVHYYQNAPKSAHNEHYEPPLNHPVAGLQDLPSGCYH